MTLLSDPSRLDAFHNGLLAWYRRGRRRFPWRESRRNAYRTLIAELMLRKTAARAVGSTYLAFIARYPTPQELSRAKDQDLRILLRPLGIIDRARLLRQAGEKLVGTYQGRVPRSTRELRTLPGVGRYTAAAVRCFGFGEDEAIVDRNVIRVLGRIFSLRPATPRPHNDPALWQFARELVPRGHAVAYNRALLDFAAAVCTHTNPRCMSCPLRSICDAYGAFGEPVPVDRAARVASRISS